MSENMETEDILVKMWKITISQYPELSIIDDEYWQVAILNCSTKKARAAILEQFLEKKASKTSVSESKK